MSKFVSKVLLPQSFVLLVALVYVSGFLTELIFFDKFGIHESAEDFLKARYFHSGILFILFPLSILIPGVLSVWVKHDEYKNGVTANAPAGGQPTKPFKFPYSTMASFLNISLLFYTFVFVPSGYVLGRGLLLAVVIIFSFLGPLAIDWLVNKIIVPHLHRPISMLGAAVKNGLNIAV